MTAAMAAAMAAPMAAAGAGAAAAVPAAGGAAGAPPLPAGWHACMHPTHQRTYYFNTVTQQSQWTFPTTAAAVPLPALPMLTPQQARDASPNAIAGVGNEFGGALAMAASYGLPANKGPMLTGPMLGKSAGPPPPRPMQEELL